MRQIRISKILPPKASNGKSFGFYIGSRNLRSKTSQVGKAGSHHSGLRIGLLNGHSAIQHTLNADIGRVFFSLHGGTVDLVIGIGIAHGNIEKPDATFAKQLGYAYRLAEIRNPQRSGISDSVRIRVSVVSIEP